MQRWSAEAFRSGQRQFFAALYQFPGHLLLD
jgi:hypothetical protein